MLAHKRMFASAIAASLLLVISGCATMFTPGMQEVPVASTPEGAEVFIDGEFVGITPVTVTVKANVNHEVVVRFGDQENAWTLERRTDSLGVLGFAADGLILVPVAALGVIGIMLANCDPGSFFCSDNPPGTPGVILSVGFMALGTVPLIVDIVNDDFYELVPKEITAEFE